MGREKPEPAKSFPFLSFALGDHEECGDDEVKSGRCLPVPSRMMTVLMLGRPRGISPVRMLVCVFWRCRDASHGSFLIYLPILPSSHSPPLDNQHAGSKGSSSQQLRHQPRRHSTASLTDVKALTRFHANRLDRLAHHFDIVARHGHLVVDVFRLFRPGQGG